MPKNQKDSEDDLRQLSDRIKMKIALFIKPLHLKAFLSLCLLAFMATKSFTANASFLSSLISNGASASANSITITTEVKSTSTPASAPVVHNSQNIPLLESSINPDVKNIKDSPESAMNIVGNEAVESNTGLGGTDTIDKQYATSAEIKTYTVKKGDTLESIAKSFGVSKNTILQANDSISQKGGLSVGKVLTILPVDGVAYTVKKGDSAGSLAKKFNATTKDILSYNNLSKSSDLQVGDSIVIPGGKLPQVVVEKPKPEIKVPEKKLAVVIPTPTKNVPSVKIEEQAISSDTEAETQAPQAQPQSSSKSSSGGFIWPFPKGEGRVSQGLHDDNAVDIAAPKGTPIYAPKDGTVLIADSSGYNGGYGLYVVIDFNDGGQMLFAHMSQVASNPGETVKQGEVIGYVGTTGSSTGNHTHFSARGMKNPFSVLSLGDTSADF